MSMQMKRHSSDQVINANVDQNIPEQWYNDVKKCYPHLFKLVKSYFKRMASFSNEIEIWFL